MVKLLQKEMPTNAWITKDNEKSLLSGCQEVILPLSKKDELTMKKMIDWVKVSQDEELNPNQEMIEAIGIAAPQIGANVNMYYILLPIFDEVQDKVIYYEHALINPKITGRSAQIAALKNGEGCLSVDKKHEGLVPRSYKVTITGYDYFSKKKVNLTARGYEAIVFQHEQDHLEKHLYYHHINKKDPLAQKDDWILI